MAIKDTETPSVAEYMNDEKEHRRTIASTVNAILEGGLNVLGQVTLGASSTTTTLIDSRITAYSFIWLMPETSNAKTAMVNGIYVTNKTKGQATLNHASNAATDQNFTYIVIG